MENLSMEVVLNWFRNEKGNSCLIRILLLLIKKFK